MNRAGSFACGVLCGVILMQLGLWLYLRNPDFIFAALMTVPLGGLATGLINSIADAGAFDQP